MMSGDGIADNNYTYLGLCHWELNLDFISFETSLHKKISIPIEGTSRNPTKILDITRRNTGVARATARWTTDEDAELTSAVANTSKKKWGTEYKTNWAAVAALVPSRTTSQYWIRWYGALDPRSGEATERTGKWTTFEDSMLKDALRERTITVAGSQFPR
jgi:hypothetical protein